MGMRPANAARVGNPGPPTPGSRTCGAPAFCSPGAPQANCHTCHPCHCGALNCENKRGDE